VLMGRGVKCPGGPPRCREPGGEEIRLLVDERILRQAVKRIVAAAKPSRVILFGSHGRGDAGHGSASTK
jgi:hypothetical protein